MTLGSDVRLADLQAHLGTVQPFKGGSDASGWTTIGLLAQIVPEQSEGQGQTSNGLDQIMRFLGLTTDNFRREARQQLQTLLHVQLLNHRCTTNGHMRRNRGEARRHEMGTIGTTNTKVQSLLKLPSIINDQ